jgi:hypothetical protein
MTMDTKRIMQRFLPVRIFLVVIVLVSLFAWISIPNFIGGGPSKLSGIINTLRQLDGAKQQWAFEHGITNVTSTNIVPATDEIVPYLRASRDRTGEIGFDRNGHQHMLYGESYVINALGASPEAVLTEKLEGWPKGARIRLSSQGAEIVLPDGSKTFR